MSNPMVMKRLGCGKSKGSCCSAVGCSMRTGTNLLSKVKMFVFPKNEDRRNAWIVAVKRKDWKPSHKAKLCSRHFITGKPSFDPQHPDYVPSLFSFTSEEEKQKKICQYENSLKSLKPDVKIEVSCTENSSSNNEQNVEKYSSDIISENTNFIKKEENDSISPYKSFDFSKLHENLSSVQKPNQFWSVAPTDKFIIFSRWNDNYIPEKRVIIEQNLSVKVFLGELEINAMNLMELTCASDVSNLLDKVDSINYCGKSLVINNLY